jgi:two-component system, cell cycle response regulator DivK
VPAGFPFGERRVSWTAEAECVARASFIRIAEAPVTDAPKTVLLVEDNEDNRIIYATALRYAAYTVLEAITGTEGVRKAREEHPDLILMDISVPELDGWEATAILKSDPKTAHIPIIAVTAHALPGDEDRSMAAGCDGYLPKPIPPAKLIAEVDRRFGRVKPSYVPRTSGGTQISSN